MKKRKNIITLCPGKIYKIDFRKLARQAPMERLEENSKSGHQENQTEKKQTEETQKPK